MARHRHARAVALAAAITAMVTSTAAVAAPGPEPEPGVRSAVSRAAQRATLTVPAQAVRRERVKAVVRVSPARRGRTVVLRERGADGWTGIAAGTTSRTGRVAFALPTGKVREAVLRADAKRFKGKPAVRSAVERVTVVDATAPTVTVDGDPGTVSGVVGLSGTTGRDRTKVTLHVDGVEVAGTVSAGGRWSLPWDSTTVADGAHELLVRAGGTTGRLSRGLRVEVDNAAPTLDAGLPAGFRLETVASGFTLPTTVTPLTSSSALVAEKGGTVRLVRNGRVASQPVIDLSDVVLTDGDMGLIGMTVAPDFDRASASGDLYLAYTYDEPGWSTPWPGNNTQRVVRYTMRNGVADPDSGFVLLGAPPAAACDTEAEMTTPGCMPTVGAGHTVDDLLFDAEGRLLVSVGDSTIYWGVTDEGRRAQNRDVLVGKILRIDPRTGLGVPDNPWFEPGRDARNRSRVLALGLRNPFRIALHPVTGGLYVGDVGGAYTEEVNLVRPGANYGWPCFEGTAKQLPDRPFCVQMHQQVDTGALEVAAPVYSYPHTGAGGSLSLGVFYEGGEYPDSYDSRLFLGDYAQSFVRTMRLAGSVVQGAPVDFMDPAATGGPVDFAMGPDGRVWYLAIMTGELRRIRYDDGCATGSFEASYFRGEALSGTPVRHTCESDAGGDWGTAEPASGVGADHFSVRWRGRLAIEGGTYAVTGSATNGGVRVRVDDELVVDAWPTSATGGGDHVLRIGTGVHDVVLEYHHTTGPAGAALGLVRQGSAPVVRLRTPFNGTTVRSGAAVDYAVRATDEQDGRLRSRDVSVLVETLHYTDAHHYHAHPEADVAGATGRVRVADDHAPGRQAFRLTAFATDSSGWRARSAPVYVCIEGNRVGPCA